MQVEGFSKFDTELEYSQRIPSKNRRLVMNHQCVDGDYEPTEGEVIIEQDYSNLNISDFH